MIVARGTLLAKLNEASVGVANKETIEQSSCFVFKAGKLVSFNEDIMVRVASPLDFDAVVNAQDLLGIIAKIPDDEIDVSLRGGEMRIKGKRRTAGIACTQDVVLPVDAVPAPEKWSRLAEGVMGTLQQAARTCGDDDGAPLTTFIHVTPERIQACDNFRLFRVDGATGFPGEVLLPAKAVAELDKMEISKVSIGKGWVHFRTTSAGEISLRCSHEPYHEEIDKLLEMDSPEQITLPATLSDIIERAEIFHTGAYDAKVRVRISDGELTLEARKDSGWYRERKKVEYSGRPLDFEVNPDFLVDILSRTRDVEIDERKMKIAHGAVQFVVCLQAKTDKVDAEGE